MRFFFLISLLWLLALPAAAQVPDGTYRVTSDVADATRVTIYPDNLALITERRLINVPKGRSVIAFEGVSDLIIPQSMVLREFSGFTLERNFDYDLIGKTSLFEKSVGEAITLTRIDKASGNMTQTRATIVSARRDSGVVVDVDGKTEVLMCSGLSERTQFDGLPAGLNPAPVMSIEVDAKTSGTQEVVISYLTSGLGWRADYRLDLIDDASRASMLGWLTLANGTAKNYQDVSLSIIAGDLNRRPETRAVAPPKPFLRANCYPKGSTKTGTFDQVVTQEAKRFERRQALYAPAPEMAMMMSDEVVVTGARAGKVAVQENVGDYKLYRVPGSVNVAPYQTKQIAFVDTPAIEMERYFLAEIYGTSSNTQPQPLQTVYEIDNRRDGALGIALPKGTMRLFGKRKNGRVIFLGEDRIDNLAVDEPVRLKLGQSFSVQMQSQFDDAGNNMTRGHATFTVSNAFAQASRVKIVAKDVRLRGGVITSENRAREADEIEPTWMFTVGPESRDSLSFGIGTDIVYSLDLDPLEGLQEAGIQSGEAFVVESYAVIKGTQTPIEDVDIYVDPVEDSQISVATTFANVRTETINDETYLLARVTHALRNTGNTARRVTIRPRYEQLDKDDVRFSNPSQKPSKFTDTWVIDLDAGADTVLSYTVRLYQY